MSSFRSMPHLFAGGPFSRGFQILWQSCTESVGILRVAILALLRLCHGLELAPPNTDDHLAKMSVVVLFDLAF